ncbi:helix-turn-helix domain-containing protein [Saccharothrix sp.]|uniref:TetR/AcrR family transcriptional regulator n=1 Tax=Saccharothrix sp. TaxID=1873460 RepID=UPI00281107A0|nr:helix-turn-helix domain-containing protein [Saccharothrix sp.]
MGKREDKRRRNTAALVGAARELFLARGYHGVGIELIAERAGLTTGAIYSLFGAKRELLFAVLDEVGRRIEVPPGPDVTDTVLAHVRAYRSLVTSDEGPGLLRLEVEALGLVLEDPSARARVALPALTPLLTGRSHRGRDLTEQEAHAIAVPLSALLRGLAQQEALLPGTVPDEVWERSALALL